MARKLKLFRTPIGFHDAYVAAPSRAAALRAWGADADLFARGAAEEVEAALAPEAIDQPGTIVCKMRGTTEEHIAALPPDAKTPARSAQAKKTKAPARSKPKPHPDRKPLDAAEAAIEAAKAEHAAARSAISAQIDALEKRRQQLDRTYRRTEATLEADRESALNRYQTAMDNWRRSR